MLPWPRITISICITEDKKQDNSRTAYTYEPFIPLRLIFPDQSAEYVPHSHHAYPGHNGIDDKQKVTIAIGYGILFMQQIPYGIISILRIVSIEEVVAEHHSQANKGYQRQW